MRRRRSLVGTMATTAVVVGILALSDGQAVEQIEADAKVLVEKVWATRLCDAIVNAGGRLVDNARIPAAIVAAAFEAAQRHRSAR